MSSDDHKIHVLMIFNQVTSSVEDVLKSYILNEILLVAIPMLKSSLIITWQGVTWLGGLAFQPLLPTVYLQTRRVLVVCVLGTHTHSDLAAAIHEKEVYYYNF